MLLYKEGKFNALGVSFTLPNGFWLETEPENAVQYGLTAYTPDKQFQVVWEIEEGCHGTVAELQELFGPETGIKALSEITPVSIGGISGHRVMYRTYCDERLEYRFAVGEGVELSVCVYAKAGNIADAKSKALVDEIMSGISLEKS